MNPQRPIEIIGGGLAGLSLGLALRLGGVPVTVIEAGGYPRHRVCGEFITGLSAATVARLGLAPFLTDALRHREIAWFQNETLSRVQRLPSPALGLSRHALDARLAAAFTDAGGELRTGSRVTEFAPQPGRVLARSPRRAPRCWPPTSPPLGSPRSPHASRRPSPIPRPSAPSPRSASPRQS